MSPATSEAQRSANRENAQLSTGPRTENGKQRTRLNGLRHGLTGQTVVMPYEDRQIYQQACADTIAGLQPANDTERALAQAIADDQWRLHRARAIEENIFALSLATEAPDDADPLVHGALTQALTFLDHAREIQLLTLYAGRIVRAIEKNKAELKALQSERHAARDRQLDEALLLARLSESKGLPYNPAADGFLGFGFSSEEITCRLDRNRRLAEARSLFRQPHKPVRKAA
jgi:hypothetical protein